MPPQPWLTWFAAARLKSWTKEGIESLHMCAQCHSISPRPRFIDRLHRSTHSRCSLLARMGIPLQEARMPYLHVPSDVIPIVITSSSSSSSVTHAALQVRDTLLDNCRNPNLVPAALFQTLFPY
jgi:hypothetical protein